MKSGGWAETTGGQIREERLRREERDAEISRMLEDADYRTPAARVRVRDDGGGGGRGRDGGGGEQSDGGEGGEQRQGRATGYQAGEQ